MTGMGMKSKATQARELHRKGWDTDRISRELGESVGVVCEWIWGKPRKAINRRAAPRSKPRAVSPASDAQREKVADLACIVCRSDQVHPAHLIDRSLGGDDDPRAVVPLCPGCHRSYDEGDLDLLPWLEPHFREELAYAVYLVGLISALNRITNQRFIPEGDARAIARAAAMEASEEAA